MLIAAGEPELLGGDSPRIAFGPESTDSTAWSRRLLFLDGKPAFELGLWCGTCPLLFQRLDGANDRVGLDRLNERLATGIRDLDAEVIATYGGVLQHGNYLPLLIEIAPRLTWPATPGDYFSEEQVATWGIDSFWGLPEHPRTPYYRTFATRVDKEAHLYEFVVPMVPPTWNAQSVVADYERRLADSSDPTAVAVTTLDVSVPAVEDDGTDWYHHWVLTHFLLDGHHKLQAAEQSGRSLRLLSLLSLDSSLAAPEDLARVPKLRTQEPSTRRRLGGKVKDSS